MRIVIAQINATIGDFRGNSEAILQQAYQAQRLGGDILLCPEMSLCGYPPMDLLEHRDFVSSTERALLDIARRAPSDIALVVGHVAPSTTPVSGKYLQDVASVVFRGKVIHRQAKTLLPTYDVFDESRYFKPAQRRHCFEFRGVRIGILICEDLWWNSPEYGVAMSCNAADPAEDLIKEGVQLILSLSASPFYTDKLSHRLRVLSKVAHRTGASVVYANLVGANDALIFDGCSMAMDASGKLLCLADRFREQTLVADFQQEQRIPIPPACDRYQQIAEALRLGISDYLRKTGQHRVHLGLSGGIDSAVVATLAVQSVGADRVTLLLMPSDYSSSGSITDARQLARNLGADSECLSIETLLRHFCTLLQPLLAGQRDLGDLTEENIQARIRGLLLMAFSNRFRSLTLCTGNKSELATGYCTLYGDMVGGLAVIGDLFKGEVYKLARFLNHEREIIPEAIFAKAPSAELRANQKDEDSLPPYDLLDGVLECRLIQNLTGEEIVARGYDRILVDRVLTLIDQAEHKRQQAPPVLKVSPRAFGSGRRMPIARAV